MLTSKMGQQTYRLYSFPKTHFVCEHGIDTHIITACQPFQTKLLVISQFKFQEKWRVYFNLCFISFW